MIAQIPSGIPVPTVFYSSPLTRAARTLQTTWTDITLANDTHHTPLPPSHKVVIAEAGTCRQAFTSSELT